MKSAFRHLAFGGLLVFFTARPAAANEEITAENGTFAPISLAGPWRFQLDPKNLGLSENWFNNSLASQIELPGSCEERGFGDPVSKPYDGRLTPKVRYDGRAWYQRDITVPPGWDRRRVELYIERCMWESTAWLDGRPVGSAENSLSTPHVYDLGRLATGHHILTVCVDNTYKLKIGAWASAITDDTQGLWNGQIGRIELRMTDPVWIADLQTYPDFDRQTVEVKGRIGNTSAQAGNGMLDVILTAPGAKQPGPPQKLPVTWTAEGGTFDTTLPVSAAGEAAQAWDEFHPQLYKLEVGLEGGPSQLTTRFGLRHLESKAGQIFENNRPLLLRGAVDECVYPLTGHPPMDKVAWTRVLKICQSYGFNYMRFHSWCPPAAAFEAADELGFLFQVELPFWTAYAPPFGQDPPRDEFEREELNRILDTYGNHPSFAIMAMGNESEGPLDQLTAQGFARDRRHLYRAEGNDDPSGGYLEGGTRGIYGPRTDWDRHSQAGGWVANGNTPQNVTRLPLIGHEVGQWDMYPNFDQLHEFTGLMQPLNFEAYRTSLDQHHMLDQDKAFAEASGKFSVLLYKAEIEGCLRTWPLGGFQVLEARDYPGQGTALVGWLDSFWNSKGLIAPEDFRHFCDRVVCLLRIPKLGLTTSDTFQAQAQASNYSNRTVNEATDWSITDEQGRNIAHGTLPAQAIDPGQVGTIGMIKAPLSGVPAPAQLTVKLSLGDTGIRNSWKIWVYPNELPPAPPAAHPVLVAHDFDDATRAALAQGGRVLLFSSPKAVRHAIPGSFMPVFWCYHLFKQTGTLGILCDPHHPALAEFPTENHSDWEWADILGHFSGAESFKVAGAPPAVYDQLYLAANDVSNRSKAIILDDSPADYRPIVQVIDNYDRNHKLGLIFEAKVGAGSLLVCAMDLETDQDKRPAARQLERSLMDYVSSARFAPRTELSVAYLTSILGLDLMEELDATVVSADSEMDENSWAARNALDDDPNTCWHTPWGPRTTPFPHNLVVGLSRAAHLAGCTVTARQDPPDSIGMLKEYEIDTSLDGSNWVPAAHGQLQQVRTPQQILFDHPVQAKYVKLVGLSSFDGGKVLSIAEFNLVPAARS